MKKLVLAALLVPLTALAQAGGPPPPGGQGQRGPDPKTMEKMERKLRLARTLGLAEALDLEPQKALELAQQLEKIDAKRTPLRTQMRDSRDVLRRAADGEKVAPADVDQAIQKGLDARAQMAQIDRESINVVTKGLSPEQKARAVLFLDRFQRRFVGPGFGPPGNMKVMKRRMPGAGGPGAMEMEMRHPGMAFAWSGAGPERRVMAFSGGPGGEDEVIELSPDLPFDDAFDTEVEIETP